MTRSHVVLLLMVFLGRGFAAPAANGSDEPTVTEKAAARATVAKWLEALRRKDAGGLVTLSARPFVLDGFDMVTGPQREACAAIATSESEQHHTLRFTATEDSAVAATMACLMHDRMFIKTLPPGDIASWPERTPSGRIGEKVGKLTTIASKQMPRPLRKYAPEIKQLSPEGFVVYLFATDNNGISVDAAFVVSPGNGGRVRAVFVSTRFEH
jgi:hypothetical protein